MYHPRCTTILGLLRRWEISGTAEFSKGSHTRMPGSVPKVLPNNQSFNPTESPQTNQSNWITSTPRQPFFLLTSNANSLTTHIHFFISTLLFSRNSSNTNTDSQQTPQLSTSRLQLTINIQRNTNRRRIPDVPPENNTGPAVWVPHASRSRAQKYACILVQGTILTSPIQFHNFIHKIINSWLECRLMEGKSVTDWCDSRFTLQDTQLLSQIGISHYWRCKITDLLFLANSWSDACRQASIVHLSFQHIIAIIFTQWSFTLINIHHYYVATLSKGHIQSSLTAPLVFAQRSLYCTDRCRCEPVLSFTDREWEVNFCCPRKWAQKEYWILT